jgi:hypothetical protein
VDMKIWPVAAAWLLLAPAGFSQPERDQSRAGVSPNDRGDFTAEWTERVREKKAARKQNETQAQVGAFAADPAHPYFGIVRGKMFELLRDGQASSMQQAYDLAVSQTPNLPAIPP